MEVRALNTLRLAAKFSPLPSPPRQGEGANTNSASLRPQRPHHPGHQQARPHQRLPLRPRAAQGEGEAQRCQGFKHDELAAQGAGQALAGFVPAQ
jgi:hypothetical protein